MIEFIMGTLVGALVGLLASSVTTAAYLSERDRIIKEHIELCESRATGKIIEMLRGRLENE